MAPSDTTATRAASRRTSTQAITASVATTTSSAEESVLESMLRSILIDAGLDAGFEPQVVIKDDEFDARVDLGHQDLRLVVEADTFEFHGTRKALVAD